MKNMLRFLLVSLSLLFTGYSYEFQDDLYPDYHNEVPQGNSVNSLLSPSFISTSQGYTVNEGETARLPCKVKNLHGFVLLWKKDGQIISVGQHIIDDDNNRILSESRTDGIALILRQVRPTDSGFYSCQISAPQPRFIQHKLHIRVKPVIQIDEGTEIILEEGSYGNLTCSILSGTPEPNLTWRKETEGVIVGRGSRLNFGPVTKGDSGVYTCLAYNGFSSQPTVQSIAVQVQYSPEILFTENDVQMLNSSIATELTCTATANPKPSLAILKGPVAVISNTSVVDGDSVTITSRVFNSDEDEEYICIATNSIGVAEERLRFSAPSSLSPHPSNPGETKNIKEISAVINTASPVKVEAIFLLLNLLCNKLC